MSSSDDKLQRLLGGPALLPLRQRLRRHFERLDDSETRPILQLTRLSADEHEALALLTGRTSRAACSMRLDVMQIDAALQAAGICSSLREALQRLDGPIPNRAAARAAIEAAWATVTQGRSFDARLQAWLDTPTAAHQLKRLARQDAAAAETLLRQADAVLRCLPAMGLTRAQLAAQTLGNAHALDAHQPAASIVLAAWRCAEVAMTPSRQEAPPNQKREFDDDEAKDRDDGARLAGERARDIWARAGILVNELARPALMLNLPVLGDATANWIVGEPAYLSLRQLMRTPPTWAVKGAPVFVCENPNLLAIAADCLGARCAPLVCTDGMPAAAQRTLLTQLLHAGARLHYHGDFDWPGLRIANHVIRTWRAIPWRLAASDYEAAVKSAPHMRRDLDETDVVAMWDPLLAAAMRDHGLSIAEEAVADRLIEDLHLI
ncbi:TIGR02679 family protein [Burkholderia sp. Bp9125]|nr:TIGR02679 family protein [Burkholderia sp. Bp9125]